MRFSYTCKAAGLKGGGVSSQNSCRSHLKRFHLNSELFSEHSATNQHLLRKKVGAVAEVYEWQ